VNKKQAKNEISYRAVKIVLSALLVEGLITEEEYEDARKLLISKLKPLVGSLE